MLRPPFIVRGDTRRSRPRRVLDEAEAAWRYTTADRRALPDYVIIGEGRSGTSYLARQLRRHPDVVANFTGHEVHYFDRYHHLGERWYRMHFPLRSTLARLSDGSGQRVVTGEKSPSYIAVPGAPAELQAMNPAMRLVVLLREPLDRAWSLHRFGDRRDGTQTDFAAKLAAEAAWIESGRTGPAPSGYVSSADYAARLAPWRSQFGEQLLVLRAEDLYAEPQRTVETVAAFVGIDADRTPPVGAGGDVWTSAASVDLGVRARFGPLFVPGLEQLEATYGISWP